MLPGLVLLPILLATASAAPEEGQQLEQPLRAGLLHLPAVAAHELRPARLRERLGQRLGAKPAKRAPHTSF